MIKNMASNSQASSQPQPTVLAPTLPVENSDVMDWHVVIETLPLQWPLLPHS